MNVLNVASPLSVVSRDAPDGACRILAAVDHALVAAGHTSLVIAAVGSRVDGILLEIHPGREGLSAETRALAAHATVSALIGDLITRKPATIPA